MHGDLINDTASSFSGGRTACFLLFDCFFLPLPLLTELRCLLHLSAEREQNTHQRWQKPYLSCHGHHALYSLPLTSIQLPWPALYSQPRHKQQVLKAGKRGCKKFAPCVASVKLHRRIVKIIAVTALIRISPVILSVKTLRIACEEAL
jgi:hypothetical protein